MPPGSADGYFSSSHTQHDVLWTASCLEPVLEDDGAANPEEEVSCTRKIDNTVDDIDLDRAGPRIQSLV